MKKVFVILSIVFILFVSIVPCFAYESTDYVFRLNQFGDSYSVTLGASDTALCSCPIIQDHVYFLSFYCDPPELSTSNDDYQIYFFQSALGTRYHLTEYNRYSDGFLLTGLTDGNLSVHLRNYQLEVRSFDFKILIFDCTSIFGSNLPTLTEIRDFISFWGIFARPSGSYTYYNPTADASPMIDFYSAVFSRPFSYLFSHWNNFTPILIVSILFICLMIFLVAMVIRRCRNI